MQMNEGCGTYGVNFWFCMTTVSFTGIFALFTRRRKLIEQEGAEHSKRWQTNLTHNVFLPKGHTLTSLSVPSGCSFPLQLNFLEAEITSRRKTLKKTTKKCSLTISSSSICLNTLHNSPGYLKQDYQEYHSDSRLLLYHCSGASSRRKVMALNLKSNHKGAAGCRGSSSFSKTLILTEYRLVIGNG